MKIATRLMWLLAATPLACGVDRSADQIDRGSSRALMGSGNSGFGFPVWRYSDAKWYEWNGFNGHTSTDPWGAPGDIPLRMNVGGLPANDEVVFRPSEGNWYVRYMDASFNYQYITRRWGTVGDIPVPGDYDNDGSDDYAVFRPGNGTWYVQCSSGNSSGFCASGGTPWGAQGDVPAPGDYDGDGKNDLAVWRPSTGQWWILQSAGGNRLFSWGTAGDAVAQADYDGDGKTDIAVFRPSNGTWYVQPSLSGAGYTVLWGTAGDFVTPLDFDGDGKADIAVWRPSNGRWYYRESSSPNVWDFGNGQAGDVPIGFTSITMAVAEPRQDPPQMDPNVNVPPNMPNPPPPVPTHGSIRARLYLDTGNTTMTCGTTPFWFTKNINERTAPTGTIIWSAGSFVGANEGKQPGLKRCRYDGYFSRVEPFNGYYVCAKAGVAFCAANVNVTAGMERFVQL